MLLVDLSSSGNRCLLIFLPADALFPPQAKAFRERAALIDDDGCQEILRSYPPIPSDTATGF